MFASKAAQVSLAAFAGVTFLALTCGPSAAAMHSDLTFRGDGAPMIEKVWYDRYGDWHEPRWRHHYGHRVADPDLDGRDGPRRCWTQGASGSVYCRTRDY